MVTFLDMTRSSKRGKEDMEHYFQSRKYFFLWGDTQDWRDLHLIYLRGRRKENAPFWCYDKTTDFWQWPLHLSQKFFHFFHAYKKVPFFCTRVVCIRMCVIFYLLALSSMKKFHLCHREKKTNSLLCFVHRPPYPDINARASMREYRTWTPFLFHIDVCFLSLYNRVQTHQFLLQQNKEKKMMIMISNWPKKEKKT